MAVAVLDAPDLVLLFCTYSIGKLHKGSVTEPDGGRTDDDFRSHPTTLVAAPHVAAGIGADAGAPGRRLRRQQEQDRREVDRHDRRGIRGEGAPGGAADARGVLDAPGGLR